MSLKLPSNNFILTLYNKRSLTLKSMPPWCLPISTCPPACLLTCVACLLPACLPAPRSPFFTWWLPNGGAVHVAMIDALYRELVPLLDSTATSVEFMGKHVEQVRAHGQGCGAGEGSWASMWSR